MATTNLYNPGDIVYLRESAAMGFIEPVRISGVHLHQQGWLYSIAIPLVPASPGLYQERRSLVNNEIVYYTEAELISHCDALILAEVNAKVHYDRLKAQRQMFCPDSPTETG